MLTSPAKSSPTGLTNQDFWGLLELLRASDQQAQGMRDLFEYESKLNAQAAELRKEQTNLLEAERQLNERKSGIDADWVRLKQAQADLDDAKATLEAKKARDENEFVVAAANLKAQAQKQEERTAYQDGFQQKLDSDKASFEKHIAEQNAWLDGEAKKLDAREAAITEREKAAAELASLMAKVKG